ncbi:SRPBCC family protein [Halobaculum sp. MBLA0147]|uniref:SRPBCC family protein n=1 Tax=Halobaculum sp. MBLA0147 TaxID=3079934 RepID=UPI0035233424
MELSATTVIDAPVAEVVAFVDDPDAQVLVTPAVTGIADVREKPDGGRRMLYGYRIAGLVLTGAMETTTYDPPDRIAFAMSGDLAGEIEWTFEPVGDDRTRFTYTARYDLGAVPFGSLLGPLRPLLAWYNRRELRRAVENTCRAVESDGQWLPGGESERPRDRSTDGDAAESVSIPVESR